MAKSPYVLTVYVWYDLSNCSMRSGWYWDDVRDRPFELAVGPFATHSAACEDARGFFDCQVEFANPDQETADHLS